MLLFICIYISLSMEYAITYHMTPFSLYIIYVIIYPMMIYIPLSLSLICYYLLYTSLSRYMLLFIVWPLLSIYNICYYLSYDVIYPMTPFSLYIIYAIIYLMTPLSQYIIYAIIYHMMIYIPLSLSYAIIYPMIPFSL